MADRRGLPGQALARLGNSDGAPLFVYHKAVSGSTTAWTVVNPAPFQFRVIDVWCVLTAAGGAADTVRVDNGSNAITDAIDTNDSDAVVSRAATIDDAYATISKGGALNITTASSSAADVFILCVRT